MPVVFKNEKQEPIVITKNGAEGGEPTKFFFRPTYGKNMQAALTGGQDTALIMWDSFRRALIGWKNLVDADGNEVQFSEAVRDVIIDSGVFTWEDLFAVIAGERDAQKKTSTPEPSKSASKKR